MKKYKCTVSYDGTHFFGSQVQPHGRTINREIEKVLTKIHKGKQMKIESSGRTDTGVHAKGQVFHFETELNIPEANWKKAINTLLPADICINEIKRVATNFHARYSAIEKEYRYFVLNRDERDVFRRNYAYLERYELDIEAMKQACTILEGTHDFTSFSSARDTSKGDKIRTLYEVSCHVENDLITFILRGNGFLYHMVRIIVAALLDVGKGKFSPNDLKAVLRKKDRTLLGKTLSPEGLFLWKVTYDNEIK